MVLTVECCCIEILNHDCMGVTIINSNRYTVIRDRSYMVIRTVTPIRMGVMQQQKYLLCGCHINSNQVHVTKYRYTNKVTPNLWLWRQPCTCDKVIRARIEIRRWQKPQARVTRYRRWVSQSTAIGYTWRRVTRCRVPVTEVRYFMMVAG
jgi:hypothetical protein